MKVVEAQDDSHEHVGPAIRYRVKLTVEIDTVSREGFGGAADAAMSRARRVFDSTDDRARVTGVKIADS